MWCGGSGRGGDGWGAEGVGTHSVECGEWMQQKGPGLRGGFHWSQREIGRLGAAGGEGRRGRGQAGSACLRTEVELFTALSPEPP